MAKFEEIKRAEKMLRLHCEENKECYGCCLYTPDGRCRVGCPSIWDEPLETRKESIERESASEESTSAESRRRILNDAIQAVCSDRCQMYGEPEDNFGVIAELWNAYLNGALLEGVCTLDLGAWNVADMMILFKLGRAATALEEHRDTYVDIAGYAACAGGMIKAEEGGGNAEGGGE